MDSSTTRVPETVPGGQTHLYVAAVEYRGVLKRLAAGVDGLRQQAKIVAADPEAIANATLCYRCLEDASMRLGKMMQALDGGVSVYDPRTTVGAPDTTRPVSDVEALERQSNANRKLRDVLLQLHTTLIGTPSAAFVTGARGLIEQVLTETDTREPQTPVVNRASGGAAIHADGHSENGGAGESGGLMHLGGIADGNSPR